MDCDHGQLYFDHGLAMVRPECDRTTSETGYNSGQAGKSKPGHKANTAAAKKETQLPYRVVSYQDGYTAEGQAS